MVNEAGRTPSKLAVNHKGNFWFIWEELVESKEIGVLFDGRDGLTALSLGIGEDLPKIDIDKLALAEILLAAEAPSTTLRLEYLKWHLSSLLYHSVLAMRWTVAKLVAFINDVTAVQVFVAKTALGLIHSTICKAERVSMFVFTAIFEALAISIFTADIATVILSASAANTGGGINTERIGSKLVLGDELKILRWWGIIDLINNRDGWVKLGKLLDERSARVL